MSKIDDLNEEDQETLKRLFQRVQESRSDLLAALDKDITQTNEILENVKVLWKDTDNDLKEIMLTSIGGFTAGLDEEKNLVTAFVDPTYFGVDVFDDFRKIFTGVVTREDIDDLADTRSLQTSNHLASEEDTISLENLAEQLMEKLDLPEKSEHVAYVEAYNEALDDLNDFCEDHLDFDTVENDELADALSVKFGD